MSVAEGEYTRQAKDPAVSLAYSYLNGDVLERRQDLAEASALVERIQSERSHQEEIDHELEAEIANVQRRISRARNNLTAALAEVVNSSEEVRAMLGELQSAWATIRGIKKAFYHLADRLQGNMDGKLYSSFQVTPSLDPAVVNENTNETYLAAWRSALDALTTDAQAPLPGDSAQSSALFPILRRPA